MTRGMMKERFKWVKEYLYVNIMWGKFSRDALSLIQLFFEEQYQWYENSNLENYMRGGNDKGWCKTAGASQLVIVRCAEMGFPYFICSTLANSDLLPRPSNNKSWNLKVVWVFLLLLFSLLWFSNSTEMGLDWNLRTQWMLCISCQESELIRLKG